jgi:hypothetical protein
MLRIQYIGIKEIGKPFRVINSKLLKQECDRLPKGRYQLTIEKKRNKKSNAQLGYLFAVIYPLVLQHLLDAGWEFTSVDEVDIYLKKMFAGQEIVNRNSGEIITIPALKREMTTTEMMSYVEAIRQWDAEYLGGTIPEPETQIPMKL